MRAKDHAEPHGKHAADQRQGNRRRHRYGGPDAFDQHQKTHSEVGDVANRNGPTVDPTDQVALGHPIEHAKANVGRPKKLDDDSELYNRRRPDGGEQFLGKK